MLLALAAVIGITASGCNRTALLPFPADGAPPDAGRDLPADPARDSGRDDVAIDAGKDQGPEGGPEARPEAPLDVPFERRPEAGPESGSDVRVESRDSRDVGAETSPSDGRSECTWPTTTSTLAELEWPATSATLAVRGDSVYVGIWKLDFDTRVPASTMVGIAISTGKTRTFPLGGILPSSLAAGNDSLFYVQGETTATGKGSWTVEYPSVARLDLATGRISVLDSEIVPSGFGILSLVGNPRGEVFWSMLATSDESSAVVKQWDQASASVKKVQTVGQPASILADDERLYWSGVNAAGRRAFFSMSTTGGKVTQIQEWPEGADERFLQGVDDQSLYFVRPNSLTKGIFAMPKAGGDTRTVVANADPIAFSNRTIDDTHVYWVDVRETGVLQRAPKNGNGTSEKLPGDDFGGLTDMAVDRCNIYWLVLNEPRVLVRGK